MKMIITEKERIELINEIAEAIGNIGWALTKVDNEAMAQTLGTSITRMTDLIIRINKAEIKNFSMGDLF